MSIDPVANEAKVALPPAPTQSATKVATPQFGPDPSKNVQLPSDQVRLSTSDSTYRELQVRNEQSNAAADAIRNTDRTLRTLSQKVDGLKAPLESIVKNFPPFSPEDQARVKLLMKYSSLRKEIDQLTLPPPPEVVAARRAEFEAQSFPAPLSMDASDSQIADHVAKLDATGAALNGTRAGLAADTASLLHDGRFARIFSRPNGADTGLSEVPLTESSAAEKSAQVGRQFAKVVAQGVTGTGSQFLRGLS